MSGAQQADELTRNIWRCAAITAFVYNTGGSPASHHYYYYVFSAAWTLLGVLVASDNVMSDDLILSTGSLLGCILSPLLFSLCTYDRALLLKHRNLIVKYADDTTMIGLISSHDESSYTSEI